MVPASGPPPRTCALCRSSAPPYRCPACLRRLCSLGCSKTHKERFNCTGQRDRTAPKPLAEMGDADMLSDYALLDDAARLADNAVRIGREWDDTGGRDGRDVGLSALRPTLGILTSEDADGKTSNAQRNSALLQRTARARGIELLLMPPGMKRSKDNRSTVVFAAPTDEAARELARKRKERRKEKKKERLERKMASDVIATSSVSEVHSDVLREGADPTLPQEVAVSDVEQPHETEGADLAQQENLDRAPDEVEKANNSTVASGGKQPKPDPRSIHWTVELLSLSLSSSGNTWADLSKNPPALLHSIHETTPIATFLPPNSQYYFASPLNSMNSMKLWKLDPSWTLGRCLVGRTIAEFPTIWAVSAETINNTDDLLLGIEGLQLVVISVEDQPDIEFALVGSQPGNQSGGKRRREDSEDVAPLGYPGSAPKVENAAFNIHANGSRPFNGRDGHTARTGDRGRAASHRGFRGLGGRGRGRGGRGNV